MDRTTRHLTAIEQAVDRLFRLRHWAACCTLLACVTVLAGCQPFDHYDKRLYGPSTPGIEPPRELAKVSMPIYRIEPPDIVQIEVAKLVPLPPYHINVFDLLQISVIGTLPEQPINGLFLVDSEGRVELGPGSRGVRVAGLTVDKASQTIEAHLREFLRTPEVSVQLPGPPIFNRSPDSTWWPPMGRSTSGNTAWCLWREGPSSRPRRRSNNNYRSSSIAKVSLGHRGVQ